MWTFKKAKSRNTSFPHNPSTEYADSQLLNSPVRHHGLTWCRGVMWGVHRIEEFSPFIGQSSPLPTEQGLMHVNPWFIKKWIDLLLQSITVIKILATLPLPSLSPPPKWKVELKNTEADQDSKHAGTAWLHQELEKKPNQTKNNNLLAPFSGPDDTTFEKFCSGSWHPVFVFSSSTADVPVSCTIGACSPGSLPGPTVWQ